MVIERSRPTGLFVSDLLVAMGVDGRHNAQTNETNRDPATAKPIIDSDAGAHIPEDTGYGQAQLEYSE